MSKKLLKYNIFNSFFNLNIMYNLLLILITFYKLLDHLLNDFP